MINKKRDITMETKGYERDAKGRILFPRSIIDALVALKDAIIDGYGNSGVGDRLTEVEEAITEIAGEITTLEGEIESLDTRLTAVEESLEPEPGESQEPGSGD